MLPLLRGGSAADLRQTVLIEHHHPGPDSSDPDAPVPHGANPTTYAALRTTNGLYVEYVDAETGYYNLTQDSYELKNIVASLPTAKRQRLHDILAASEACKGAEACWNAQRMSAEP